MPTIDDLRSALEALAEQAPTTEKTVLRRRRKHLRPLAIASAAAAIAAVATVPVLVTRGSDSTPTPPVESASSPAPTTVSTTRLPLADPSLATLSFSITPVQGMTAFAWETGVGFQRAFLTGQTFPAVTVYPPGGWAPTRSAGARDASVGTKSGFFGPVRHDGPDAVALTGENPMVNGNALAWQYAPGAWALVESVEQMSLQQMRQIAAAVRFDTKRAVSVPANFSYLPAGFEIKGITTWLPRAATTTRVGDQTLTSPSVGPRVRLALGKVGAAATTAEIGVGIEPIPPALGNVVREPNAVHVQVGDFTGTYNDGFLQAGNGTTAAVDIAGAGEHSARLSQAEEVDVVQALGLVSQPGDIANWLTVADVRGQP